MLRPRLARWLLAAPLAFAALLPLAVQPARAEVTVPPLKARVTDLTGTLSAAQRGELEQRLAAFEAKRGSQFAVLMLPTTAPEEIEQFSIRVAEAWKIGRKGADDGMLLIVAKDDRRLRIEVGYGLEGVIPDSIARRVIEERITPRFREGDFFGGIRDGVDQLMRLAEGEKLPPPAARGAAGAYGDALEQWVVPAFVFIFVGGAILKALFGRAGGSLATAAVLGIAAWWVFGLAVAVFAGIAGFVLAFANYGRGGGWSSGGGWSGGGSSWGGGGSGWSGGGGGFGGGGSSGRW